MTPNGGSFPAMIADILADGDPTGQVGQHRDLAMFDGMTPGQALDMLIEIATERASMDRAEADLVAWLRGRRMPWALICDALGMPERTLRRRHASNVE